MSLGFRSETHGRSREGAGAEWRGCRITWRAKEAVSEALCGARGWRLTVRTLKDVEARELRGHSLSSMEGAIWSPVPELDTHLTSGPSSSLVRRITPDRHLLGSLRADRAAARVKMDYALVQTLGDAQRSDRCTVKSAGYSQLPFYFTFCSFFSVSLLLPI